MGENMETGDVGQKRESVDFLLDADTNVAPSYSGNA
jgi:hypothetical protein